MNTTDCHNEIRELIFPDTETVGLFTLENDDVSVEITNLGCSIKAIYAPCNKGIKKNIVAGFSNLKEYNINEHYFGCILGRYANRIAGGSFNLNGKQVLLSLNDGQNHLHGGYEGFNKKKWNVSSFIKTEDYDRLVLSYLSKDGEEGYPGNLEVTVSYLLNKNNQLIIEYQAVSDYSTLVSLSNHSYFNLSGFDSPDILDHYLYINAENYLEKNHHNIPTGKILPVSYTPMDFLNFKKIGCDIEKISSDDGYDHDFVLNKSSLSEAVLAASLKDVVSGRFLNIYTQQPVVHLYSANYFDNNIEGVHGCYKKYAAVALETQAFSDSPNHLNFPNAILNKDEKYFSTTIYEFGVE